MKFFKCYRNFRKNNNLVKTQEKLVSAWATYCVLRKTVLKMIRLLIMSGLFFQRFWGWLEQPKAAPMLSFEGKKIWVFCPFFEFSRFLLNKSCSWGQKLRFFCSWVFAKTSKKSLHYVFNWELPILLAFEIGTWGKMCTSWQLCFEWTRLKDLQNNWLLKFSSEKFQKPHTPPTTTTKMLSCQLAFLAEASKNSHLNRTPL